MDVMEVTRRDCEPLAMLSVSPLQVFEQHAISFVFEHKMKVLETRLPAAAKGNLEYLAGVIRDDFIVPSLTGCKNRKEYFQFWAKNVREFNETVKAYRVVLSHHLRESSLDALVGTTWEALKQEIQATLTRLAGNEAAGEFEFCFSTAERTNRLIASFDSMEKPRDLERDQFLLGEYLRSSVLFIIGLFSFADMANGIEPRNEEILEEVFAFTRQGALCSYAAAREAYSLRQHEEIAPDALVEELFSDADDVVLANATIEDATRIAQICDIRIPGQE
jgi:hypothetical protein